MNNLEEISLLVKGCTDCQLAKARINAVPGEGDPQAELMFIGAVSYTHLTLPTILLV